MGIEIERKFLVRGAQWKKMAEPAILRQGYLASMGGRTVRVRIEGTSAFLTIKGPTKGIARSEWEYPIPVCDAESLLDELCDKPIIEKQRYRIVVNELTWEIDEFFGANAGLIMAEVELPSEDYKLTIPEWIGEEVTGDPRYYNSSLAKQPYSTWNNFSGRENSL